MYIRVFKYWHLFFLNLNWKYMKKKSNHLILNMLCFDDTKKVLLQKVKILLEIWIWFQIYTSKHILLQRFVSWQRQIVLHIFRYIKFKAFVSAIMFPILTVSLLVCSFELPCIVRLLCLCGANGCCVVILREGSVSVHVDE